MGVFTISIVLENNVVAAALDDADGGHERELCIAFQVGKISHAAVAHGGLNFVNALFKVVVQRACIGYVRVDTLLKLSLL